MSKSCISCYKILMLLHLFQEILQKYHLSAKHLLLTYVFVFQKNVKFNKIFFYNFDFHGITNDIIFMVFWSLCLRIQTPVGFQFLCFIRIGLPLLLSFTFLFSFFVEVLASSFFLAMALVF